MELQLAPLRGITTYCFRRAYARYFTGIDRAVSFFIPTISSQKISQSYIRDVLPDNNQKSIPLTPQLLSNNPDDFVRMANYLFDYGYDTVNLNIGCPFPTVINKKRGCGLLSDNEKLLSFLDNAVPYLDGKISIKTRLGLEKATDLREILPQLNHYPIKELIIHPRTARQLYAGSVNLAEFEYCTTISTIPVVYNGDITSIDFFQSLKKRFPTISSWMLGRGILQNPFLPIILRGNEIGQKQKLLIIRDFHHDLFQDYQRILFKEKAILGKMKELWFYLSASVPRGNDLLKNIQKTQDIQSYERAVFQSWE